MINKTKPLTEKGNLGFNNHVADLTASNVQYRLDINNTLLANELSTYVGRFVYEGLPKGLNTELIETMMYYKGQLAFFKVGLKYYMLPFVYTGSINQYGIQTELIPIPFNGMIEDKQYTKFTDTNYKAIVFGEHEVDKVDIDLDRTAIVLRERSSMMLGATLPSIVVTNPIREKLGENVMLVRNNLILSHPIKYVNVDSQDKAGSVNSQTANLLNNVLNGNVVQAIVGQLKFDEVNSHPPTIQVQQLWQNYASLDSIRTTALGLVNNGAFEKRERVLTDEIQGKQIESKLILKDHLNQRKLWAELVNEYFDLNVSVRLCDELVEKDLDNKVDNRDGSQTKVGYDVEEDA